VVSELFERTGWPLTIHRVERRERDFALADSKKEKGLHLCTRLKVRRPAGFEPTTRSFAAG
jgi:hypothetical protein